MSARQDLAVLLEQWFQFTQAEGAAIESAAWAEVREIQARKAALQKALAEVELRLGRENSGAARNTFRATVGRLISLEARNAELLAAQLRRARAQQESLNEAERNLHKIQRSYVRRSVPTAWQSYS
jgi:hypothetical protein